MQQETDNPVSGTKINLWGLSPIIAAVICIGFTILAWHNSHETVTQKHRAYFEKLVEEDVTRIKNRFLLYEQSLWGGVGLINAAGVLNREAWTAYVDSLGIDTLLPGISGIGFIDNITEDTLPAYLEETRQYMGTDFLNIPQTSFRDKFIIRYISPIARNQEAIGLDIGFEATRREAAEQARDSGQARLTRKIDTSVRDNQKETDFLLLIPVYQGGKAPDYPQARQERIRGWVYAPFIGKNFLHDINDAQVSFKAFDGLKKDPQALIYASEISGPPQKETSLSMTTQMNIAGQTWMIEWSPTAAFHAKNSDNTPLATSIMGLMLTFGISGVFFLLSRVYGKTARSLRENVERVNTMMKSAVDGIIIFDENGAIESFNPAAEKIFGFSAEEIKDANISTLIATPGDAWRDALPAYDAEGQKKQSIGHIKDFLGRRKDGTIFPFDVTISHFEIRNKPMFSGFIRDITERKTKEAHSQLIREIMIEAASSAKYEEIIETVLKKTCLHLNWPIGHAYIWNDRSGCLESARIWYLGENPEAYEEFKILSEFMKFNPGQGLPGSVFNSKKPAFITDFANDKKFPRSQILKNINLHSAICFPIMVEEKVVAVFEFFSANYTKESQPLLEISEALSLQLSRVINRITAEKERETLISKLVQSNDELERFAYVASHDLQEPLRMVTSFTGLLRQKYGDKLDEDAKKYIEIASDAASRMQNLISSLLEYSRIDAESRVMDEVDLDKTLGYVANNLAARINETGAVINHKNLPTIKGNPAQISSIFQNLIGNAIKYQKAGSTPVIDISWEEHQKEWIFRIQDNGIGMKQEYCEQIFLPFKRLHNKEEYPGSGMGLAICRKILGKMGGSIRAESAPDRGSTFIFTVPKY